MSGSTAEPESPMEVTTKQPLAAPSTSASGPRRVITGVSRNRSGPQRSVNRNRSGPMRGVNRNSSGPMRGVNRNKSGPLARAVARTHSKSKKPDIGLGTGSFHRSQPNRATSTGSLRKATKRSILRESSDEFSVASTNTMDSIMVAKKRITGIPSVAEFREKQNGDESIASEIDDISLHTVDSINVHANKWNQGGDDGDSLFSESFVSTTTYCLSDYEQEDPGAPQEYDKMNVEIQNLNISDKIENLEDMDFAEDFEEEESLKE